MPCAFGQGDCAVCASAHTETLRAARPKGAAGMPLVRSFEAEAGRVGAPGQWALEPPYGRPQRCGAHREQLAGEVPMHSRR